MGLEYIYGALLLHELGKEINEDNLKSVVSAAGVEVNEAMVKAVVENLKEVNIEEAIKSVSIAAPVVSQQTQTQPQEEKKEEKKESKEDKEKKAEEAAAGLGALFG